MPALEWTVVLGPPATRIFPSGSRVAVCPARAVLMEAVGVHVPVLENEEAPGDEVQDRKYRKEVCRRILIAS